MKNNDKEEKNNREKKVVKIVGQSTAQMKEVFSLNPAGLRGIDPSGLEHFLVGD